jgi:RND family efflux transporter MFP subunit
MRLLAGASRLLFFLIPTLPVVALSGCSKSEESEGEHPAPVRVVAAEPLELGEWTELVGTVEALPHKGAQVSAAVTGQVVSILKTEDGKDLVEGDEVSATQVIGKLDDRVIDASWKRAQAAVQEQLEQVKEAGLAIDLAKLELDALAELETPASAGTPKKEMSLVSRIALAKARLALKEAEARKELAQAKVKTAREDVKVLAAQRAQHLLRAPIRGQLGAVHVVPGQTLAAGAIVAEVLDLKEIDIKCFVPPHLVGRLVKGQRARLAPDAPPEGTVEFIANQAQAETGNVVVKVRFPNPKLLLRANRVQRIDVLTQEPKKRVTIPVRALHTDEEPPQVVVIEDVKVVQNKESNKDERHGKARRLRVQTGVRDTQGHVEVLALTDPKTGADVPVSGAQFVVEGGHGLEDGDKVIIQE